MGKKIHVPCLDVTMIVFFKFSIRNMVFQCIFLGKKPIIITSKYGRRIFFPITILFWENFTKTCPEKRSKIQTTCAHAPWASYNTPWIQLIQYGRRIGKKVYWYRPAHYLGLRKLVHHLATDLHIFAVLFDFQGDVNNVNRLFFLCSVRLKRERKHINANLNLLRSIRKKIQNGIWHKLTRK